MIRCLVLWPTNLLITKVIISYILYWGKRKSKVKNPPRYSLRLPIYQLLTVAEREKIKFWWRRSFVQHHIALEKASNIVDIFKLFILNFVSLKIVLYNCVIIYIQYNGYKNLIDIKIFTSIQKLRIYAYFGHRRFPFTLPRVSMRTW